jgi:hypothetical protein
MNENYFKDDLYYADVVTPTYDCYGDDDFFPSKIPDIDDVKNGDDVDTYHQYVGSRTRVIIGDEIRTGKLVRRKREPMPTQCLTQELMEFSFQMAAVMSIYCQCNF